MNILLVDLSPLLYAVHNSRQGKFTTKAGEPTGLRFGILRSIRHYEKLIAADRTIIVLDAQRTVEESFDRSDPVGTAIYFATYDKAVASGQFATYKKNRKPSPELWAQVPPVLAMLALTHWTQAHSPGFEADDVIGTLTRKLRDQGHDIFIATNDGDMDQLVSEHVRIVDMRAAVKVKGVKEITEKYDGLAMEYVLLWRAVTGDPSDNIKGVMSKAAARALFNTKSDILGQLLDSELLAAVQSNLELMSLHDPGNITIVKGQGNEAALTALFTVLEFKSLLPRVKEFTGQILA